MGTKIFKSQFNGGEVSSELFGMVGDAKYQTGAAMLRNFLALPHGPASNRLGTEFVCEIKNSGSKARLIPFNFGVSQSFAIELGSGYFRFHADGLTLQYPSSSAWSSVKAYEVGDLSISGGITYYAKKSGTNKPPLTNPDYWYAQPSTGEYEIPNEYTADDLHLVKYEQNADVLTLAAIGYVTRELKRYGNTRWILEYSDFGSPISAPAAPTITPSGYSGSGGITYSYAVTAIIDGEGESVKSADGSATNNLYTTGAFNTVVWPSVTGASRYNVYRLTGGIYGYVGSTTGTTIIDDNIAPDIGITPPIYDSPFAKPGSIASVAISNGGANYPASYGGGVFTSIEVTGSDPIFFPTTLGVYLPVQLPVITIADPTGSGAVFTFNKHKSTYGTSKKYGAYIKTPVFDITSGGSNYSAPAFEIKDIRTGKSVKADIKYEITDRVKDVYLSVSDETGIGAELVPEITAGVITGITVKNGGSGYTSPTVTITDNTSTGSGFVAGAVTIDSDGDYPGCVSYFEQRKVFAGSEGQPQNFWLTRTGTESSLAYHIPILDDDRISRRISSRQVNQIRHIVPMNDLIFLTNSAEWRVTSVNSDAITPTSISAKAQSYIGSSHVRPVVINNTVIFCAAKGGHVRELGYSSDSGGYATGDLSLRASHLFDGESVVDMCITKTPYPIVWAVSSSGLLLGLTYIPEQNIYAWHSHDTAGGFFESCCSLDSDGDDSLYVIVRRNINGDAKRYIERIRPRKFNGLHDAYFVDCGITYNGAETSTITGLDHLNGMDVSVLADGCVVSNKTVEYGSLTLDVAASIVHIGLPIVSYIKTLPASIGVEAYGQGRMKNVSSVWVRVDRSSGIWAGPSEADLTEAKQRSVEPYDSPAELMSKEVKIVTSSKWDDDGQVVICQREPLPLTVVSVTLEVTMGD